MGLKEKASAFRNQQQQSLYPWLQSLKIGQTITQQIYDSINSDIKKAIQHITDKLDKKLIDMQTLFEIGRELSSTLSVNDLIQIIIFTLIGQYQISDVAVISIDRHTAKEVGKRGFSDLEKFELSDSFIDLLTEANRTLDISDISPYKQEFEYLSTIKCKSIVPMKGKENLIGFILMGNRFTEEKLTEEDLHFTYTLSTLAGVSLETASLYERLDKKYNELSALYEISRVINSAQDTELVLDLIKETLSTGFGVKSGIIILKTEDVWQSVRSFEENSKLTNLPYNLNAEEQLCIANNKADIIQINEAFNGNSMELFIPLFSVKTTIGAIIITDFENYMIEHQNVELINLFAIIASQISPPILMSQLIHKESVSVQDPYTPVVSAIDSAIKSASEYDLDATFLKLSVQPYNKFLNLSKKENNDEQMQRFINKLSELKRDEDKIIRLSLSSFLFVLPAIAPTDVDDLRENVELVLSKTFDQDSEIKLTCEWQSSRYPDNGKNASDLLALLE